MSCVYSLYAYIIYHPPLTVSESVQIMTHRYLEFCKSFKMYVNHLDNTYVI